MDETLFDLRLKELVSGPLRQWLRLVPRSRRQLYMLALACGLFHHAWYRERYNSVVSSDEELFAGYLKDGWLRGRLPSERFHAHRYARAVEGFEAGMDEPVLHALLTGMGNSGTRKEILRTSREPVDRSDIVSVRSNLRMKFYEPCLFKGEVHLLSSREDDESGKDLGWDRLVEGQAHKRLFELDSAPNLLSLSDSQSVAIGAIQAQRT